MYILNAIIPIFLFTTSTFIQLIGANKQGFLLVNLKDPAHTLVVTNKQKRRSGIHNETRQLQILSGVFLQFPLETERSVEALDSVNEGKLPPVPEMFPHEDTHVLRTGHEAVTLGTGDRPRV